MFCVEALACFDSSPSSLYVIQEEWPYQKEGEDGQYFNITQIHSNVHGFSLDYHVAIFFTMWPYFLTR